MKTMDWKKIELGELEPEQLVDTDGGQSLLYYISYDVSLLLGSAARVTQKVVESLYYGSIITPLK
jgi:hypothetical protein